MACTLDLLGDKWTLLVVRDLFTGQERFEQFLASREGMASNILADRLARLQEGGIVEQRVNPEHRGRPTYHLTDRGLAPALQSLASRAPFAVEIIGVPQLRLNETTEAAIYYVVAESLTNAAKHSGASEARVEMSTTNDTVIVEIRDNGCGGASLTGGTGIRGLADRVEALDGTFELESPPETGTVIRAEFPLS